MSLFDINSRSSLNISKNEVENYALCPSNEGAYLSDGCIDHIRTLEGDKAADRVILQAIRTLFCGIDDRLSAILWLRDRMTSDGVKEYEKNFNNIFTQAEDLILDVLTCDPYFDENVA